MRTNQSRSFPTLSRSNLLTIGLCAVVALGVTAVRTTALPSALPKTPPPPVVGLVNLEVLINGLSELKERNEVVRARGSEIQKQIDVEKKAIDGVESELKLLAPKKDEKKTPDELKEIVNKRLQLAEMSANLEAKFKGAQQRIELEKGATIRELYLKSLQAIEDFSKKEGFDLVVLDDRSRDVPELATNSDMSAVIEGRRVLYANGALDITDRVRVQMENDWAASGKSKSKSK